MLLKGAEELFIKKSEVGCLLVHGFTGSPYEMKEMANYLAENNITVYVPLLKGHGTNPQDMFKTNWLDWQQSVSAAYLKMKSECKKIFICGLSMGAALSLHSASHYKDISGVISLSAPIFLDDPKLILLPLAKTFPIKAIYKYDKKIGTDIKDEKAKSQMVCYDKTPVPCVISLVDFLNHLKADLQFIECPSLIMHAKEDHLVPYRNAKYIYDNISAKDKEIITLNNSYHVITMDFDKKTVFEKSFEFIKKYS